MAKFSLGQIVATPPCLKLLASQSLDPRVYLARHARGDWGDMAASDKAMNDAAVISGESRIFSSYDLPNGEKVWVITEWDRSATTLLRPEDY